MWDTVTNVLFKICSRWVDRPRVKVQIRELKYYLFRDNPDSRLAVIVLYPSTYSAEVEFSHHGRPTTIRDVMLAINGNLTLEATGFKPIKLSDGDYVKQKLVFPVQEKLAVKEGTFELQAVDADSKVHRCKGQFPISRAARHAK